METVKCNLCGSDNYRVVYSMPEARYFVNEWFNVVECNYCGLGFVNPRPTRAEISKYYPSSFYDYFDDERDYHLRRYAAEARFLPRASSDYNKLLLDIGCANGDFPRYMQQLGWEVEGVEVSLNSKAITHFKVYKQEFTEIPVYEPRYDAITAWAVLEHIHDPMAYFRKAAQVLKAGGIFAFLVTNFESVSSRCLFLEDIPRHLYFFTESTIRKYLSISGFELIKRDYSNQIYSMHPINFLRYYLYRYILRRRLKWNDIPFKTLHFFEKGSFKNCWMKNMKRLISNPLYIVDRILMPIYEKYQVIFKKYGIVTYVTRRH
ncbi:MAG TPA: class I SAM-dependent methyltransferase [Syntrophales bacterium]|nr:class I SAM-dependent methyltransferase [Syntrophales bacterium]